MIQTILQVVHIHCKLTIFIYLFHIDYTFVVENKTDFTKTNNKTVIYFLCFFKSNMTI